MVRVVPSLALAGLVFAVIVSAGCTEGGVDLTADATLNFDGDGNGSHSERGDCGDEGRIWGSGNVSDGEVRIRLEDTDGTELFDRTFDGEFNVDKMTVNGDSGSWTLEATRSGDDLAGDEFKGEYDFKLSC